MDYPPSGCAEYDRDSEGTAQPARARIASAKENNGADFWQARLRRENNQNAGFASSFEPS